MSGEPKTHTLTLEEALKRLDGMPVEFDSDRIEEWRVWKRKDERLTPNLGGVALAGSGVTWMEAASEALGVRVVARDEADADLTTAYMAGFEEGRDAARDEAAELRAALEQIAEGAPLMMPTSLVARKHWELATIAREALRRLAGGENEK